MESQLTLIGYQWIYIQQNHLQNFQSLNTYDVPFQSREGLRWKKFPHPHHTNSSPFQHKFYVPCSNGIIENYIKNPLLFWESRPVPCKNLKSNSQTLSVTLFEMCIGNASWHGLYFEPGCLKYPDEIIQFCNIRNCLFSLLWIGSNQEVHLCGISSW